MVETLNVQVEGMTCTGCEQRIETALGRVYGVREVAADHRTGQVRVRFDPASTNLAALLGRITLAGCEVRDERTGEPGSRR